MTTLITPNYLEQNMLLHSIEPTYGTSSWQYAPAVKAICLRYGATDVLDYGCGKGRLAEELTFPIAQYDPAIVEFSHPPAPADIVVCGDVMEHVEVDCVVAVLDDIHRLTRVATYWIIATRLAAKSLPDGRNCHLVVEPHTKWEEWLAQSGHRVVESHTGRKGEAIFTTTPE